jgi:hypothetical protein
MADHTSSPPGRADPLRNVGLIAACQRLQLRG